MSEVHTIGPSRLRNHGAKGVIKAAQKYLAAVSLSRFLVQGEASFLGALDGAEEELRLSLPQGAQHWGAARKALNLFLRDRCHDLHEGGVDFLPGRLGEIEQSAGSG